MKYATLPAFEKHLKEASPRHLSSIYVLLVKEDFERMESLKILLNQLGCKTPSTFQGKGVDAKRLFAQLHNRDLFGGKSIVVVHEADKLPKETQKQLEKYYEHPSSDCTLIITAPALNRATNFYKKAEKAGVVLDLPEEKPWEKEKSQAIRIEKLVNSHGKKIAQPAVHYLLQAIGADAAVITSEIEKLLCYIGDRQEITSEDIAKLTASVNLQTGWQLGDAIFNLDIKSALGTTKSLLDEGVALIALLRQIRSQFQTKYQVLSLMNRGDQESDITARFPYMRGKMLNKTIGQVGRYGESRFRKGLLAIDETELSSKSSGLKDDYLAEQLIIKLAT